MIKPELYKRTVDILVDAYFNDTLTSLSCHACAVGNIVKKCMGYTGNHWDPAWSCVHTITPGVSGSIIKPEFYKGLAKKQIDSTGYSYKETAAIELAFERGNNSKNGDPMFNGLMAVIDVLDEIHENTDTETTNATKQRFICQH